MNKDYFSIVLILPIDITLRFLKQDDTQFQVHYLLERIYLSLTEDLR